MHPAYIVYIVIFAAVVFALAMACRESRRDPRADRRELLNAEETLAVFAARG